MKTKERMKKRTINDTKALCKQIKLAWGDEPEIMDLPNNCYIVSFRGADIYCHTRGEVIASLKTILSMSATFFTAINSYLNS